MVKKIKVTNVLLIQKRVWRDIVPDLGMVALGPCLDKFLLKELLIKRRRM